MQLEQVPECFHHMTNLSVSQYFIGFINAALWIHIITICSANHDGVVEYD